MIKSIWIDMDDTLINWSKGNKEKALIDIEDPDYYYTLEPIGTQTCSYLSLLRDKGISLHIISGIPDPYNCAYVPYYNYDKYYEVVCAAKDYTIEKYFSGIFNTVDYITQSESKASYLLSKYDLEGSVFIDDMEGYVNEWKSIVNHNAYLVGSKYTCEYYLCKLISLIERG